MRYRLYEMLTMDEKPSWMSSITWSIHVDYVRRFAAKVALAILLPVFPALLWAWFMGLI